VLGSLLFFRIDDLSNLAASTWLCCCPLIGTSKCLGGSLQRQENHTIGKKAELKQQRLNRNFRKSNLLQSRWDLMAAELSEDSRRVLYCDCLIACNFSALKHDAGHRNPIYRSRAQTCRRALIAELLVQLIASDLR